MTYPPGASEEDIRGTTEVERTGIEQEGMIA